MTDPLVGATHDVVIHLNDSTPVGLTLWPNTYRIGNPPMFLPAIPTERSGADRSGWKSWVQDRFDGGAGQTYYSGPQGNNRFAESSLIDIGLPTSVGIGQAGQYDPSVAISALGPDLANSPLGDLRVAMVPRATTGIRNGASLFSSGHPTFLFKMSNRPHMFHYQSATLYTTVTGVDVFSEGALAGAHDALTGSWAVINTQLPAALQGATKYSGVVALAFGATGVRVYGKQAAGAAVFYTPAYSTHANLLSTYDKKLWRTVGGKISFFDPATRLWSAYSDVGDAAVDILNTYVYGGMQFFGKEDSLWVFDAGRIYEVENFTDEAGSDNFNLMTEHRGALYFNIRQKIYRYSVGGGIEILQTPHIDGVVKDGSSIGHELHILIETTDGEGDVLIFDPETGGTRRWFSTRDIGFRTRTAKPAPGSLDALFGHVFLTPMHTTAHYSSINSWPVVAVNRVVRPRATNVPYFAKSHAYAMLSMVDVGLPNLDKLFNRVVTDYTLNNVGERIDVSYLTDIEGSKIEAAKSYVVSAATYEDGTTVLTNGSADRKDGSLQNAHTEAYYYFLFEEPVSAFRVLVSDLHSLPSGIPFKWELSIGGGSYKILKQNTEDRADIADETEGLQRSGMVHLGKQPQWAEETVDGDTGYVVRLLLTPTYTWEQEADLEEADTSDFDAVSPAWDKEVDTIGEFDAETDADGDMNAAAGAAHDGADGLYLVFDDANVMYGRMNLGAVDQASLVASFWFNAVDVATETGKVILLSQANNGAGTVRYYVQYGGDGVLTVVVNKDGDVYHGAIATGALSAGWHHILVYWRASSAGGADDGATLLYVDYALVGSLSGIDNDTHDVDYLNVGMVYTNSTSFGGSYYLDTIKIDPVGAPFADKLAVKNGTYGLAVPVMDTTAKYVDLTDPTAEKVVTVEFQIDPNTLAMGEGDDFWVLHGHASELIAFLKRVGSDYKIYAAIRSDTATYTYTAEYTITDAFHRVRLVWAASPSAGSNAGYLYLYIDRVLREVITGVDNDTHALGGLRFGATSGLDAGTYGIFYLDDCRWSKDDYKVELTEVMGIRDLQLQKWISLGSITDEDEVQSALSFPDNFTARQVMLKYDMVGSDVGSPEIRRVELEYLPPPSDRQVVDFTVIAVNNLQLQDMTKEHSGGFVAASLFSMSKSGLGYVAQLPWPPPVAHTIKARVHLQQPGAVVPILAYTNSFMGGTIPIRLEEL